MPAEHGNTGQGGTDSPGPDPRPSAERRTNLLFRSLIDEMMGQVRELQAHAGPWPADERARAEADLERIMGKVRAGAFRNAD
jgi:hypothetical protein